MEDLGPTVSSFSLAKQGFAGAKAENWNLSAKQLYDQAITRGEGIATDKGAFAVTTGLHTGRSAQDKRGRGSGAQEGDKTL